MKANRKTSTALRAGFALALTATTGTTLAQTPAGQPLNLRQAIALAEHEAGGDAVQAERLQDADGIYYRILVSTPGGERSLRVDARHGAVLAAEAPSLAAAVAAVSQEAPHDDAPTAGLHATLYTTLGTGQLAGMNNTVLSPKLGFGTRLDYRPQAWREWETQADVAALYGSTQTGDGRVGNRLQELRGRVYSGYDFYRMDGIARAGVGLYSEFALPFHSYTPYAQQQTTTAYSAEEGERLSREFLYGLDLKFSLRHDRLQSDFDNILFASGNRIGPNLITYKPLLGFRWHNEFFMLGNLDAPQLSLFTDIDFYFARKANTAVFNTHDGLGGTKREIYLSYGLRYYCTPQTAISLQAYGYNNLNRGNSAVMPNGFRDGFLLSLSHAL